MADNRIQEASWDVVNSTHDINQTVANTAITAVDRNMRFAQNAFLGGIEVLEREADDLRNLTQEWSQQVQKQQDAYQKLWSGALDTYMHFLRSWFSFYQQVWGVTRSTVDREFQFAQQAAQRGQENA
jgi:predicted metal-dependent hydrolase